jgi:hypothetical protein
MSLLNESQQRRLEATLYLVDKAMGEIVGYLHEGPPGGEMYVTANDLTPFQRDALLRICADTREKVACVKNAFELPARTGDLGRIIAAQVSSLWENVHNCRSKNLRGFGKLDPVLAETLDPQLDEIITLLDAMMSVLSVGDSKGP